MKLNINDKFSIKNNTDKLIHFYYVTNPNQLYTSEISTSVNVKLQSILGFPVPTVKASHTRQANTEPQDVNGPFILQPGATDDNYYQGKFVYLLAMYRDDDGNLRTFWFNKIVASKTKHKVIQIRHLEGYWNIIKQDPSLELPTQKNNGTDQSLNSTKDRTSFFNYNHIFVYNISNYPILYLVIQPSVHSKIATKKEVGGSIGGENGVNVKIEYSHQLLVRSYEIVFNSTFKGAKVPTKIRTLETFSSVAVLVKRDDGNFQVLKHSTNVPNGHSLTIDKTLTLHNDIFVNAWDYKCTAPESKETSTSQDLIATKTQNNDNPATTQPSTQGTTTTTTTTTTVTTTTTPVTATLPSQ